MTPREQRKQPEFIAKRTRLIELRDKLKTLGYESNTYQINTEETTNVTEFVIKKRGRKRAA